MGVQDQYRADGTVDKKKGRLVAKGFTQQYGIDFLNTWSPAVRAKTLRLVIILATRWDMEIEQLDVETAFLNARMNEEVYMQLPEGYEQQLTQQAALGTGVSAAVARAGGPLVCRLVMCLYGTKQASMEWNREVNRTLTGKLGFARSVCDPCLYHRVSRTGRPILLCLFVDDLVSAHHAPDGAEWRQLKALFTSTYRCKDGGAIYSLLGMRLLRDRERRVLRIDQQVYVQQMLEQTQMADCKPIDTPAQPGVLLPMDDGGGRAESAQTAFERRKRYESVVGTLLYAAMSTRPDMSFAVNQLARHLQAPAEVHDTGLKRAIRYCKKTASMALVFDCGRGLTTDNEGKIVLAERAGAAAAACGPRRPGGPVQPECVAVSAYCDADWGGCVDSRRSTTGFVVFVFGCPVSWMSKKQKSVALSSTEAEYMALSAVIAELQWLHQLLAEIGLRDDADTDQHADDDGTDAGNGGAHAHGIARGGPSTVATGASGSSRPVPPLGQRCAGGRCSTCTTLVRSDNQSAISQVTGQSDYHARSKHVDIRHHFVKAASQRGEVQLQWVQSADQLADVFTKPLDAPTFARLRDEIMGGGKAQQGDAATTTATTTTTKTRAADVAMLARETDADDDGSGSSAPAGPQGTCTRPRCSPPGREGEQAVAGAEPAAADECTAVRVNGVGAAPIPAAVAMVSASPVVVAPAELRGKYSKSHESPSGGEVSPLDQQSAAAPRHHLVPALVRLTDDRPGVTDEKKLRGGRKYWGGLPAAPLVHPRPVENTRPRLTQFPHCLSDVDFLEPFYAPLS